MRFRFDRGDGDIEEGDLRTGPAVTRFRVGSPTGETSATWRAWTNKNGADVYVAPRSLARFIKLSLHESGDWRSQITSEYARRLSLPADKRWIDRWPRPEEHGLGLTRGCMIWVTAQDVVIPGEAPNDLPDTIVVPKPKEGYAIGFHIVFCRPDVTEFEFKGFGIGDAFALSNGEACLLLVSQTEVPSDLRDVLGLFRSAAPMGLKDTHLATAKDPRLMLSGMDDTGVYQFWDIAVPRSE